MKFRINRKLNNCNEEKLIIQVKKWWYFSWRDLYWCKEESDGDEYYQKEFPIDQYLQAKDFIEELEENPERQKYYYTLTKILGFTFKL